MVLPSVPTSPLPIQVTFCCFTAVLATLIGAATALSTKAFSSAPSSSSSFTSSLTGAATAVLGSADAAAASSATHRLFFAELQYLAVTSTACQVCVCQSRGTGAPALNGKVAHICLHCNVGCCIHNSSHTRCVSWDTELPALLQTSAICMSNNT